jgi:protein-S-isoprenylcysteine O-methyltransferase Ste14
MHPPAARVGPAGRAVAWLGGAAFVASLAYFLYSFAVRYASPPPPGQAPPGALPPLLINTALFTVFALHHSLMARTGAKRWLCKHVTPALERTAYVWISSVLFAITCWLWQPVPGMIYEIPRPWSLAGWSVQAMGIWLTLDGARAIDLLDLAGIRQATGGQTHATLQARGAYGLVRHPIYLGWALVTFGAPVMTSTRFSFACISTAYLIVAIPFEERSLAHSFGDAYRDYRRRVRWRMVPGVY